MNLKNEEKIKMKRYRLGKFVCKYWNATNPIQNHIKKLSYKIVQL